MSSTHDVVLYCSTSLSQLHLTSEGEFYTRGFILFNFIELVTFIYLHCIRRNYVMLSARIILCDLNKIAHLHIVCDFNLCDNSQG